MLGWVRCACGRELAVSWVLIWAVEGFCAGSLDLQAEDLTGSRTWIPAAAKALNHPLPELQCATLPRSLVLSSHQTSEDPGWLVANRLREKSPADYQRKQTQVRQHHSLNCGNVFCQVTCLKVIEGACNNTVRRTLLPHPVACHCLCQHIRIP